jgi:proteasome lid subunit RPN8/RPN11
VRRSEFSLSPKLSDEIVAAARRAYPRECCGLIEGVATDRGWIANAIHEAANLSEEPAKHFLVDPAVQFALLRGLRQSGRTVIGCFHSHPDGEPEPSEADRMEAAEDEFVWLIAAGNPVNGFRIAAHVFEAAEKRFERLALRG